MDIKAGQGIDIVGRAESIPLEDESVDSVVCTQVFEHLNKPFESVIEISRILKVGGYLLLTVPLIFYMFPQQMGK
jgi:ubiquinone/menaquinone biosynthesis C-methylase UbiE